MINIYAQSFMTATRNGDIKVRDLRPVPHEKRLNWFTRGNTRYIDPDRL